jgi:hypothetical protein
MMRAPRNRHRVANPVISLLVLPLAVVFSLTGPASRTYAAQSLTLNGKQVTVSSTSGWQRSPFYLSLGQRYSVSYISGTWTVDYRNFPRVGPQGYSNQVDGTIYPGCKYDSNVNYAVLLGKTGNGGTFPIGAGGSFIATQSGYLSLRINDGDACLTDNVGQVVMKITPHGVHLPGDSFGWAVGVSGSTAVIGAPGVLGSGAAYVYERAGSTWKLQAVLTDPAGTGGDLFGYAVAISGNTVVVGAWGTYAETGAAYIYARHKHSWKLAATLASPAAAGEIFGYSVSDSGKRVIVGSFAANDGAGAAYVYQRSGAGWYQQATLTPPAGGSAFGAATAISGTTAVIGAWGTNGLSGTAYIYAYNGGSWHRRVTLLNPSPSSQSHFGSSVSVSQSVIAIGAPAKHSGTGESYIYAPSGGRWRLRASLRDPRGRNNDNFGWAVAVTTLRSGPRMVASAPATGTRCGAAYEYMQSARRWHLAHTVVEPHCKPQDKVGISVAISGKLAIVGVPGKNNDSGLAITLYLP